MYCEECECLEDLECSDDWTQEKCQEIADAGKCMKTKFAKYCKMTCDKCGCVDIMSTKKCLKNVGKCNKAFYLQEDL